MSRLMGPDYAGLTQDFLRKILELRDGKFYWKDPRYSNNGARIGDPADHVMIRETGHLAVNIFPYSFSSARLAVLYSTGEKINSTPKHINGDNADNRIENLKWKGQGGGNFMPDQPRHQFDLTEGRSVRLTEDEVDILYHALRKYIADRNIPPE